MTPAGAEGAVDPGAARPEAAAAALALRVGELLERARADGTPLAVMVVDCGLVGRVDAAWGYDIGNAVRARVAAQVRQGVLRPADEMVDLGRDEFACLLPAIAEAAMAEIAADKMLRAMETPLWAGDDEVYARPAIGIAVYPMHGEAADALLQRAASACLRARSLPGRVAAWDAGYGEVETARLLRENRLRSAVAEDTLEMVFQPQYELRSGRVVAAESVLCWREGAQLVPVQAAELYTAAEAAGKVMDLTASMLNRALRNCSEFRFEGGLDLRVAVNLSAEVLLQPELPDLIARALKTWTLRPSRLVIEVVDIAALEASATAQETLARIKRSGVKFSIDDPKTRLRSLLWLATMEFDELKLPLAAVPDIEHVEERGLVVRALAGLAHDLRMDVVALGVENDAMAARLTELGCDAMQADYKGPACDPKAFVERYGFDYGENG